MATTVPEIAAGKGTSEASGSDDAVRRLWRSDAPGQGFVAHTRVLSARACTLKRTSRVCRPRPCQAGVLYALDSSKLKVYHIKVRSRPAGGVKLGLGLPVHSRCLTPCSPLSCTHLRRS